MSKERLMVDVLHHLTQTFKEHAILKGGYELSLFSSQRHTNDLNFVFVPFNSKKEIVEEIRKSILSLSKDITVNLVMTSKNAKFFVKRISVEIEVEVSVAPIMESVAMNTAVVAKPFQLHPQIIRVMKPEVAFAHKLAAWNERRLVRDLYDIYFWFAIQNIMPDEAILRSRLKKVESRIPGLAKRKMMTVAELCQDLKDSTLALNQKMIDQELSSLPVAERQHLDR